MYTIVNEKKITIRECKSFFSRLIGNMFKKNINECLLFNHCNSIHTFFMLVPIDVVLCDKDNTILYIYNSLKPDKIILPKKNVFKVYEFPNNTIHNININEKMNIYN